MSETVQISEEAAVMAAATTGDQIAFSAVTERYRKELRLHCYRMLGSFDESEDLVQETFLKAWRGRGGFAGRASLRAWLYGIATNACLDFLARSKPREPTAPAHVAWLQPYPDRLLDEPAPREAQPDAAVAAKENIGLAFLVAMQFLPAKQRAALILCDVLDWSAKEAAELLDLSVAAVNSGLARARTTLRERRPGLLEWKAGLDPDEQQRLLLARYVTATERGDAADLASTLREDVRFEMPPWPGTWQGRDTVVASWIEGGFGTEAFGTFRCLVTRANRMPAVAGYVRKPGDDRFRPLALDVLEIEDGLVKAITTFPLEPMLAAFDLPAQL